MIDHMKCLTFYLFFICAAALSAAPAGPAFAGLSAIKSQSYAGTSQVVEIRGERGEPQPAEWIVILHDPSARGGVRELTIVNGQITAERTPLRGPTEIAALVPMDSSMFKLDSDAVFRTVQSESVRNQIGFDWIDYKLRTDPETKAPAWSVCLFDKEGSALATMRISAGDGALLCPLQVNASARARKDASEDIIPVGGLVGTVGNAAVKAANKTKNSALHLAGTLQEVFVGERTIGPNDDGQTGQSQSTPAPYLLPNPRTRRNRPVVDRRSAPPPGWGELR